MPAIKLVVRALVGREAVEFELRMWEPQPPEEWRPRTEGRGGVRSPLFLTNVRWSPVLQAFICPCEDDVADDLGGVEELVEAYTRAGWCEVRRLSLFVRRPTTRTKGRPTGGAA